MSSTANPKTDSSMSSDDGPADTPNEKMTDSSQDGGESSFAGWIIEEDYLNFSDTSVTEKRLQQTLDHVRLRGRVKAIDLSGISDISDHVLSDLLGKLVSDVDQVDYYAPPTHHDCACLSECLQKHVYPLGEDIIAGIRTLQLPCALQKGRTYDEYMYCGAQDDAPSFAGLNELLTRAPRLERLYTGCSLATITLESIPTDVSSHTLKVLGLTAGTYHVGARPTATKYDPVFDAIQTRVGIEQLVIRTHPHRKWDISEQFKQLVLFDLDDHWSWHMFPRLWIAKSEATDATIGKAQAMQPIETHLAHELASSKWDIQQYWDQLGTKGACECGAPVKVAIVDGGVDCLHPLLKDRVRFVKSYVRNMHAWADETGHGTHAAGILVGGMGERPYEKGPVGIAPDAELYVYRVLDSDLQCDLESVAEAVTDAVEKGCRVISMSLGGPSSCDALYRAVHEALAMGVVIVCAATNEGRLHQFNIGYPARYGSVLCVGSHTSTGLPSSFSAAGREIDFLAPGEAIKSVSANYEGGLSQAMSGTSVAAPMVAGLVALLLARDTDEYLSNCDTVRSLLCAMTTSPGHHLQDSGYGVLLLDQELKYGVERIDEILEHLQGGVGYGVVRKAHSKGKRGSTSDKHAAADRADVVRDLSKKVKESKRKGNITCKHVVEKQEKAKRRK